MAFLLDTNVVSEARKQNRADPQLAAWLRRRDSLDLYLSVISIMEIEIGVKRMERRDPRQGVGFRRWLEEYVLPTFERRILPVTVDVARCCAGFHVPDPKPERDSMIAATAMVHRLVVATRNRMDFAATGVTMVDPWTSPT